MTEPRDGRIAPREMSVGALILANLVPLVGVLAWDWDVAPLVIFYWSENIVLGVYTLVKMIHNSPVGGIFMGMFFLIHYGGFCAVHGLFVLALTREEMPNLLEGEVWPFFLIFVQLLVAVVGYVLEIAPPEWLLGFAALFVSHGVSLVFNYFGGEEYKEQDIQSLMMAPYKRIVVLHIAIIAGGFAVMALGSPVWLLVILVILKIGLDIYLHLREHSTPETDETAEAAPEAAEG